MSKDDSLSKSLLNAFGTLYLSNDLSIMSSENDTSGAQKPNGTHDLTCRTTETDGDTDNSDDTKTVSVAFLDSSNASTDVSFAWISNSSVTPQSKPGSEDCGSGTDTIPETSSDINIEDSIMYPNIIADCDLIMDNRVSTPIKRKHNGTPVTQKNQSSSLAAIPQSVITRSGRAVRRRIDLKFDYTSEHHDDDSDSSDNLDFGDIEDDSDNDDHEYSLPGCTKPTVDRPCISMLRSCCGSSTSVMLDSDTLIYLNLSQPTAVVSLEPTTDDAVEHDTELKTRIQKFLGLIPPLRRLYNPMSNFEFDEQMDEDEPTPAQQSRFWASVNNMDQSLNVSTPKTKEPDRPLTFRPTTLREEVDHDMKILIFDHLVMRANAKHFESKTPQHIKEPIDLSGLPSVGHRALICRGHKKTSNMIGPHTGLYNFVDSLKPTTPLNMCHPLAVKYRKRSFAACKRQLAITLFHILNHSVFHCGLHPNIIWKSCMNTHSTIKHRIEAGGRRVSSIVLWKNIKRSEHMVKALVHEMCHAAAFDYHGETGHGDHSRKWSYRAKTVLPELPEILDCDATYKYTCLLCRDRSFGNMKFEDEAPQLRCHYCQFEITVEQHSPEDLHSMSLTDQLITPYKDFMRANYLKCEQGSHSAKMRVLNVMYKEHQQQALPTNP